MDNVDTGSSSSGQDTPQYLSMGVDFWGFLKKEVGDLEGITTLAHELIQNADDAKDEQGNLAAKKIIFDITDEALLVSNDATFREDDFNRIRRIASGEKRSEQGARPTGAFGIGFLSVYQITDHPEILSAGRHWLFKPEEPENKRIEVTPDTSLNGTLFRFPWALDDSLIRRKLGKPPVSRDSLDKWTTELKERLPRAILFLKSLNTIELGRNGQPVMQVNRYTKENQLRIEPDGGSWRIIKGSFSNEARALRERHRLYLNNNRAEDVQIAIPDFQLKDGLLFATLPTEQSTGLPFHINADFFPDSDRKSIAFGEDHLSDWNRAAIQAAAEALKKNLESLRLGLQQDHKTFWFMLERLEQVCRESNEDERYPVGAFWETIVGELKSLPVIYTINGKWHKPAETRIASGMEQAIPVFTALGIEIVHQDLQRYHNILTSAEVGVQPVRPIDIFDALNRLGLVSRPADFNSLPKGYQSVEGLKEIWKALEVVLGNLRGPANNTVINFIKLCALAPSTDGKISPFASVYRADNETQDIFRAIIPKTVFLADLAEEELSQLCPEFSPRKVIDELSRDLEGIDSAWQERKLDPKRLLMWLEKRKLVDNWFSDKDLISMLVDLPIFPSGGNLKPLKHLMLPGNFFDPIGLSEIVDMEKLHGLRDFLCGLGAKELTFVEYVKRYVRQAFSDASTNAETKRKLVKLMADHIGEIREDREVRNLLANVDLVECDNGCYKQPQQVYFRRPETEQLLKGLAHYVRLPDQRAENIIELYKWLGVALYPRAQDVVESIARLTRRYLPQSTNNSRQTIVTILEALGGWFKRLTPDKKAQYDALKRMAWLPAEGDHNKWYRPSDIFASYNKTMFESQAKFLDATIRVQQGANDLLEYLGVNLKPEASQVIGHLKKCALDNVDPPRGIYSHLNNLQPIELEELRETACLRVRGKYLRPDQVIWGSHPFGRFRVELDASFNQYGDLLIALGVKRAPDYTDAIKVLQEIQAQVGDNPLGEDRQIVLQCWKMLSDELLSNSISPEYLSETLSNVKCIPNQQGQLCTPASMFFEDRPGLVEKFPDLLRNNTIRKPEQAWHAMHAAGVQSISNVVIGDLIEPKEFQEDPWLKNRVKQREQSIKRIITSADSAGYDSTRCISLDALHFICADQLQIIWHLDALGLTRSKKPEPICAHLVRDKNTIYFSLSDSGEHPWTDLARELAIALALGADIGTISPGLSIILSAQQELEVVERLDALGISRIEMLPGQTPHEDTTIASFDEQPSMPQDDWTRQSEQQTVIPEHIPNAESKSTQEIEDLCQTSVSQDEESSPEAKPETFSKKLFEAQTVEPGPAQEAPVLLPIGGPKTEESAKRHTEQSIQIGRAGSYIPKVVFRWEPKPASKALSDEFKSMVHGDYTKRCQICGETFQTKNNDLQVYVVHIVEPSVDHRTNHFGDLASLCGLHYAQVKFGKWAFIDPNTDESVQDPERLEAVLLNAERKVDEMGHEYVAIPIRFFNVYQEWEPNPTPTIDEEIRYSIPHWKYLRALLVDGGD